jgi:hypothetical protein
LLLKALYVLFVRREADYDDEEDDYGHYGEEEDVGQQGLQPTKEDPGLFIVTCRCAGSGLRVGV